MTKYHLFAHDAYDASSASSQYIGAFDSAVDAYNRLEDSGADYGELMTVNDSGELELVGEASPRYPMITRTDTSIMYEYGWVIDGQKIIAKTETADYKATKSQIEAAAREFAETHKVEFLGIGEYTNPRNARFYITVRFDWTPKYNIDWRNRERIERSASYQWEFGDDNRLGATASELISGTVGEQLEMDKMGHDEFTGYARGVRLATGMTSHGFGVIPIGRYND